MKYMYTAIAIVLVVILGAGLYFGLTAVGRAAWNSWFYTVQKADDRTAYSTRKEVEDTCRTMIASYTKDKNAYQQYEASTLPDRAEWAEQAKMRANATAATYNEYVLKNSFVWDGNIPTDIDKPLEIIQ